jgi:molecular chaperone GrpE
VDSPRIVPIAPEARVPQSDLANELQRARERFEREAARVVERQRRAIIGDFLEVLDDVDRALEAASDSPAIREGVDLVRQRFLAKLAAQDVTPMEADGARFDPNRHEAMSAVPVSDPAQDNRVLAVLRRGYVVGDEVLRPAGVAVGRLR